MNNAGRSQASIKWLPFHQSSERAWNANRREAGLQHQGELGLPLGHQAEGADVSAPPLCDICSSPGHFSWAESESPKCARQERNFLKEMEGTSRDGCVGGGKTWMDGPMGGWGLDGYPWLHIQLKASLQLILP